MTRTSLRLRKSPLLAIIATMLATAASAEITAGNISALVPDVHSQQSGQMRVVKLGDLVIMGQEFTTNAQGSAQLLLADGSSFTIGPNSTLVIDRFIYDPEAGTAELAASAGRGVFRFIGGAASKSGDGVKIKTPVGTAGIRGGIADFQITSGLPPEIQALMQQESALSTELAELLAPYLTGDAEAEGALDNVWATFLYGESLEFASNQGESFFIDSPGEGFRASSLSPEGSEALLAALTRLADRHPQLFAQSHRGALYNTSNRSGAGQAVAQGSGPNGQNPPQRDAGGSGLEIGSDLPNPFEFDVEAGLMPQKLPYDTDLTVFAAGSYHLQRRDSEKTGAALAEGVIRVGSEDRILTGELRLTDLSSARSIDLPLSVALDTSEADEDSDLPIATAMRQEHQRQRPEPRYEFSTPQTLLAPSGESYRNWGEWEFSLDRRRIDIEAQGLWIAGVPTAVERLPDEGSVGYGGQVRYGTTSDANLSDASFRAVINYGDGTGSLDLEGIAGRNYTSSNGGGFEFNRETARFEGGLSDQAGETTINGSFAGAVTEHDSIAHGAVFGAFDLMDESEDWAAYGVFEGGIDPTFTP